MVFTPPGVRISRRSASARTSFGESLVKIARDRCSRSAAGIVMRPSARTAAARTGTGPPVVNVFEVRHRVDAGREPRRRIDRREPHRLRGFGVGGKGHQRSEVCGAVQRTRELHRVQMQRGRAQTLRDDAADIRPGCRRRPHADELMTIVCERPLQDWRGRPLREDQPTPTAAVASGHCIPASASSALMRSGTGSAMLLTAAMRYGSAAFGRISHTRAVSDGL